MKLSHKAALLAFLVYPGAGHYLLKRHLLGTLYAASASVCLWLLLTRLMEVAQAISERILSGEIPLDIVSIRAEISLGAITAGSPTVSAAIWVLVGCWLISTADAFRLGRQQERAQQDSHAS